jgi:hypothetical protein
MDKASKKGSTEFSEGDRKNTLLKSSGRSLSFFYHIAG